MQARFINEVIGVAGSVPTGVNVGFGYCFLALLAISFVRSLAVSLSRSHASVLVACLLSVSLTRSLLVAFCLFLFHL